jgi:hypothetical protein
MSPHGRLAQLVERNIDVVDATGSSPVPPTRIELSPRILGLNSICFPRMPIIKV